MNRESFEHRHGASWQRAEALLDLLEARRCDPRRAAELPALHRRCCQHLALARQRHLGADLEERLNGIALRGHHQLYRGRLAPLSAIARFLVFGFPELVRREAALFWLASLLLYGPALAVGWLVWREPETIHAILDGEQLRALETMYGAREPGERGASSDIAMFGFYVWNNVSIAFRTFAGGIFAGLGTIFFLTVNGLLIGAVAAHLTSEGAGEAFWSFVITHGAFELTAIVIAGAAGLRLGLSVLAPGRLSRGQSLKRGARVALKLALGVAALLIVAAFVEAFWSATRWPSVTTKYLTGALAWLLVGAWLLLAGRASAERDDRAGGGSPATSEAP